MSTATIAKKKVRKTAKKTGQAVRSGKVKTVRSGNGKLARGGKGESFDKFKTFNGQLYTGVQIGRGHHWNYDPGDWKETKITPDLWEISYAVTKRRVGKAPEDSGVPVGTQYHWYILANQTATKLNANDYETRMTGLKFKLAHKRADKNTWSATGPTQRKHLIAFLRQVIDGLEKAPVILDFEFNGQVYKGEGVPVMQTCLKGFCYELDIMLNGDSLGIIRYGKSGWKMDLVKDQKLVDAIGAAIMSWFDGDGRGGAGK